MSDVVLIFLLAIALTTSVLLLAWVLWRLWVNRDEDGANLLTRISASTVVASIMVFLLILVAKGLVVAFQQQTLFTATFLGLSALAVFYSVRWLFDDDVAHELDLNRQLAREVELQQEIAEHLRRKEEE